MIDQHGTPRPNAPLIAMAIFGAVAMVGGIIGAVLVYSQIVGGNATSTFAVLATFASSISGLGLLLLIIAWTVAAARYR